MLPLGGVGMLPRHEPARHEPPHHPLDIHVEPAGNVTGALRVTVLAPITAAATFQARWWRARAELARLAGDPEAVRVRVEQLRRESLAQLLSLDGWLGNDTGRRAAMIAVGQLLEVLVCAPVKTP